MHGSILDKYSLSHINVTHVSQQFWCERQVELSLAFPKEDTAETIAGKEIHRDLLLELASETEVRTMTRDDAIYVLMLNISNGLEQLLAEGITRELYVFGKAAGFPIAGIVDEISLKEGRIIILDHKTRLKPSLPPPPSVRPTEVQLMLYHKLLEDLVRGNYSYEDFVLDAKLESPGNISAELKEQLEQAGMHVTEVSVEKLARGVFDAFRRLPPLSDFLIARYIHQGTGDHIGDKAILYDPGLIEEKLAHAEEFWAGRRKSVKAGFREKWKCNYCEYRDAQCTEKTGASAIN